jgi:SAM-dependent methyltransferase
LASPAEFLPAPHPGSVVTVDALPEDPAARREALERWADEQLRRTTAARLRAKVVRRLIGADRLARSLARTNRIFERVADRVLDRGLNTAGEVKLPEHAIEDRVVYVPAAWHVLPRALRYLGVSDRDTFVDFGCGKGRVVHQAARRPFRRVIGVEVSPALAEIARAGLAARAHQHRCPKVEIVVSDVRQFRVPDDLTMGFFFWPFGDETLATVLRGIIESLDRHPRRVRLIYLRPPPRTRSTILETGRFRLLKEQSSSLRNHLDRVAIFESR